MADLLNMQQAEYDEIQAKLESLHQNVLADTREIMEKVRTVCEKEGGFYVDKISAKINMILECIEGQVLSELETNFEAEKAAMEEFVAAVKGIDVS